MNVDTIEVDSDDEAPSLKRFPSLIDLIVPRPPTPARAITPNLPHSSSEASLLIARCASRGDNIVLEIAIQKDPGSVNSMNTWGTPLQLAVDNNHIDTCLRLLECGADPDLENDCGTTALMIAARWGRLEIIKILLTNPWKRADVAYEGLDGTALMWASGYRQITAVLLLCELGANVDQVCSSGQGTSLSVAALKNDAEMISTLVTRCHATVNLVFAMEDQSFATALSLASRQAQNIALSILYNLGGDVNIILPDHMSPLLWAVHNHHLATVKKLILFDVNVNKESPDGKTPLIFASMLGFVDIIEILMEAGADCNQVAVKTGMTALHWAASLGQIHVILCLCDKFNADTNKKNPIDDSNAYDCAKVARRTEALQLLEDRGCYSGVMDAIEASESKSEKCSIS